MKVCNPVGMNISQGRLTITPVSLNIPQVMLNRAPVSLVSVSSQLSINNFINVSGRSSLHMRKLQTKNTIKLQSTVYSVQSPFYLQSAF